jgi:hypothetical protein
MDVRKMNDRLAGAMFKDIRYKDDNIMIEFHNGMVIQVEALDRHMADATLLMKHVTYTEVTD